MKIIMLTLCVFVASLTFANATEMYRCLDKNGNEIITTAPQDWMTDCELKDSYDDTVTEEKAQKQNSPAASNRKSSQADDKLSRECAKLDNYRQEARTFCEGIPQSYKSGNAEMKKTAQNRVASSSGSVSQNCDFYRGMVRDLEAKCR